MRNFILIVLLLIIFCGCKYQRISSPLSSIKSPKNYEAKIRLSNSQKNDTIRKSTFCSYDSLTGDFTVLSSDRSSLYKRGDSLLTIFGSVPYLFYTLESEDSFNMLSGNYAFYALPDSYLKNEIFEKMKWTKRGNRDDVVKYMGANKYGTSLSLDLVNNNLIFLRNTIKYDGNTQQLEIEFRPAKWQDSARVIRELGYPRIDYYSDELLDLDYEKKKLGLDSLTDLEKNKVEPSIFDTGIVLIDYFYMACAPCIKSIPKLNFIDSAYTEIRIYSINPIDAETPLDLKEFSQKYDLHYPIFLPVGSRISELKKMSFPTLVLLKDGQVVKTWVGYNKTVEDDLFSEIEQITKQK